MRIEKLGTPCRNWCFFETEHIPCDPYDGREKMALSTCVPGGKGQIIILDTERNTAERYELPDETAAWAILYLPDYGKLLAGTCPNHAYVFALDLKTRTWSEPAELPGEKSFWNMCRGKDGKVYGSNSPHSILFRYDPATHTLDSAGRVGDDPENNYSQNVFALPNGNIIASTGSHTHHSYCYHIDTGTMTPFGVDDEVPHAVIDDLIVTETVDTVSAADRYYRFYDADTLALIDKPVSYQTPSLDGLTDSRVIAYVKLLVDPPIERKYSLPRHIYTLNDGTIFGLDGQGCFLVRDGEIEFRTIPIEAPPVGIFALAEDETGRIWFAAGLGQTIGWYDPETGDCWNSQQTTTGNGETYGIVPVGGKIYLTSYAYGYHTMYDPANPVWDMHGNQNPVQLAILGDRVCRPIGRSILGPDGNIWTGWGKPYGYWGGGITRINTADNTVDLWLDQIPEHSIGWIAAGKSHLFASTSGQASGRSAKRDAFYLLKLDMDCNIVWKEQFALGQFPTHIVVMNGKVYMILQDDRKDLSTLRIYDEETMALLQEAPVGGAKQETWLLGLLRYDDTRLVVINYEEARLLNIETMEVEQTVPLRVSSPAYHLTHDKWIYYAENTALCRFRFDN